MNYVTFSFRLGNMMCHTFLLRERESGGELGQIAPHRMDQDHNMWLHKVNYLLIHFDENT